jgi:hypothetical protein
VRPRLVVVTGERKGCRAGMAEAGAEVRSSALGEERRGGLEVWPVALGNRG